MDMDLIKRTGMAAAYKGAAVLRSYFGHLTDIRKKGQRDLVTEADVQAERIITETIRSRFPDHGIMAEEGGASGSMRRGGWIIDPLDGTTNFAHGLPIFAVSIAFAMDGETRVGIVLNPITAQLCTAVKGQGAHLNGRPIRVSRTESMGESLLATGFPYDLNPILSQVSTRFTRCAATARGIRRLGAAAIDLCLVAAGVYDGFWEENLKPWDTAAGVLIAEEAGATVSDFSGERFSIHGTETLVTNGHIHGELIDCLRI